MASIIIITVESEDHEFPLIETNERRTRKKVKKWTKTVQHPAILQRAIFLFAVLTLETVLAYMLWRVY